MYFNAKLKDYKAKTLVNVYYLMFKGSKILKIF